MMHISWIVFPIRGIVGPVGFFCMRISDMHNIGQMKYRRIK